MRRLGIKEEEYLEMDSDEVDALMYLYQSEDAVWWERAYEMMGKLFGGK